VTACNIRGNGFSAFYAAACHDPSTVIDAQNNWWGFDDSASIEGVVYHRADNSDSPTVSYIPCAEEPFLFDFPTGVFETFDDILPSAFTLLQNYPNPFNNHTVIEFNLERPSHVQVNVHNILGQLVRPIVSEYYSEAGVHTVSFDGNDRNGRPLPSGVYLYRLTTADVSQARKMVLLK
jgi:hypothetical protein